MCASTFYVTKTPKAQGHNDKRIPQEVSENPITRIKEKKQMEWSKVRVYEERSLNRWQSRSPKGVVVGRVAKEGDFKERRQISDNRSSHLSRQSELFAQHWKGRLWFSTNEEDLPSPFCIFPASKCISKLPFLQCIPIIFLLSKTFLYFSCHTFNHSLLFSLRKIYCAKCCTKHYHCPRKFHDFLH